MEHYAYTLIPLLEALRASQFAD